MKTSFFLAVFFFLSCKMLPQEGSIFDLYPTRTGSISYAVQTNNMIDCYAQIRQLAFNDGPWIPPFKAGFYLSTDTSINTSDILIGDYSIPCMNGAQCGTYASPNTMEWLKLISVTGIDLIQQNVPAGTYFIGIYLDRENVISEWSDSNNGAPLKGSNGNPLVVKHHLLGIDVTGEELKTDLEKRYFNDELLVQSRSGNKLCVELFSLDGRLFFRDQAATVLIPRQGNSLFLLRVSNGKKVVFEKCVL